MIATETCFCHPLKLLCFDLGCGVVSARVMILEGLVDRDDVGRLSRCRRERSERHKCKERDKSDHLAARSRYPVTLSHGRGTMHAGNMAESSLRRSAQKSRCFKGLAPRQAT
jgi:hypothetical protein